MTPHELLSTLTKTLYEHYQLMTIVRNDCNASVKLPALSMQVRLRKSNENLGQSSEMFWRLRGRTGKKFGLAERARVDLFGSSDQRILELRTLLKTESPEAFEDLKVWETIRISLIFRGRLLAESYRQSAELVQRFDTQDCEMNIEQLKQSLLLAQNYGLDQLAAFPIRKK